MKTYTRLDLIQVFWWGVGVGFFAVVVLTSFALMTIDRVIA